MLNILSSAATLLAYGLAVIAAPPRDSNLPPAVVPTVPPPTGFTITSLGVLGSGCPAGSTYYVLSTDRTAVTVTFSQYYAEAGPGIPISHNRRNCQLTFGINVPSGFTYAIASVDYRGYYQLDANVVANQTAIYYFQGQTLQASARSNITGPIDGEDYVWRDNFDLVSTVTSPCGIPSVINVNSDLRVSNSKNPQGVGYIATDSIDTSLNTTLNFQWQKC